MGTQAAGGFGQILVPFRRAEEELKQFVPHMHTFLSRQVRQAPPSLPGSSRRLPALIWRALRLRGLERAL
jgi:hypothetical protein